ncbi:MAG: hypothetical protein V4541_03495 [Bacteroidota bacterium]
MKRIVIFAFLIGLILSFSLDANAQCSMCTINAEQSTKNGNTQGNGLNDGIVYLLSLPYLLIGGVGILWYRNYRKKMAEESLNG